MQHQSPAIWLTQRDNEPFRDGCRLGPNPTILSYSSGALALFIEYQYREGSAIMAIATLVFKCSTNIENLYFASRFTLRVRDKGSALAAQNEIVLRDFEDRLIHALQGLSSVRRWWGNCRRGPLDQ